MNKNHMDHEVRIRIQEKLAEDTRELFREIKGELHHLDNKMDSQFKWIIGTTITLFGGIILHIAKLI